MNRGGYLPRKVGRLALYCPGRSFISSKLTTNLYFVCVGVMYSGEYDVCDVTLSVHPHRAS